ncbi:MAG: homocysteine S-methyltransferase family protein [Clostridia bacterium]|nr:homocysteine S-methyltransferase family protein [Clostridia bacterium]
MKQAFQNFPFSLPMILDGATGTELIKAGMPSGVCPEAWILEHPDVISHIQKRYIDAGANAVLAPTFGANREVLARYGLSEKVTEMNIALARLSREAAKDALVGGDLSPTGKYLRPIGDMDADTLIDIYFEQATALDPYVDFFMIETNMDLAATRMAVLGAKKASKKPIFVTLTVTESGKTMSGDDPKAAFLTLSALGISAFGLNCSTGPREMKTLLSPLKSLSYSLGIPLIAKPNAGAPAADGTHTHLDASEFADICREMAEDGILILGGCCGTNAEHIAAIQYALLDMKSPKIPEKLDVSRLASTARIIAQIPEELPDPIIPDEDFADNADEMADEEEFIYIQIENEEDADIVLESAPFLSAPLAVCGNENAIQKLERYFCGKILTVML